MAHRADNSMCAIKLGMVSLLVVDNALINQVSRKRIVHTYLRVSIFLSVFIAGFLVGYNISSRTGSEPGYFNSVESGAYGVTEKPASPTGLDADDSEYYKSLLNQQQP